MASRFHIVKEFGFEAAHHFPHKPDGHENTRMHGHSFKVEVELAGEPDKVSGCVVDFEDVTRELNAVRDQLDHHLLNSIEGLSTPSLENIAQWIATKLNAKFPQLVSITVRRPKLRRILQLFGGVMAKKCVVLHSGGLDSTVCLLLARKHGREPRSLGISYGQRQQIEIEFAAQQCKRFGFERHLVDVGWQKPHIDVPTGRTMEQMRDGIAPTFLPGRNAVFLAIACAEAAGAGAEEVWIGVNAVDYSGYPDCRESFLTAFRKMWAEAVPNPPRIVAPLVNLTKPQIAALAKELGLKHGETWSCYAPDLSSGTAQPCGVCDACILHNHAWEDVANAPTGQPDIPA